MFFVDFKFFSSKAYFGFSCRLQKEQIVSDNQDIIDKLSTCVTEQSVRAQKAEVCFGGCLFSNPVSI